MANTIKYEHAQEAKQLGVEALDPYLLSFDDLVSEIIKNLNSRGKGKIIAERRNDNLDNQLQLAWLNLKINGTSKVKPAEIKDKLEDLQTISKGFNQVGLQLADLIVTPIGRYVLGIKRKELGHEVEFEILKKKIASDLTIFPKK